MYIQALIWFLVAWLFVTPTHAGFVVGLIAAFASTTIGGIIVNAAIGIALSIGASLIQGLFKKPGKDPGTSIQLRVGGANPLIFPLGESATAGVRVYYGAWQESDRTPNEFVVDVIAVSAIPVPGGATEYWLNDQKITLDTSGTKPAQGWPIVEYRKDGRDHAWLDFHDGTQTTVNPYLAAKFGSHPNYPWQNDMIGRGVAYVTLTCRYNKDGLWQSGFPNLLVGLSSIPLYDPRLDSTNGGSGPHRWGQFETYEPSNNAMVRAYNVARGIYFEDEWVYGGQNWPAMRLPVSSWMAGMNACDLVVDGIPQFHGGGVVECDIEIAKTLEELLNSSSGLIAEIGGAYKIRTGAPGAPVMSFNDSNILVTREQGYDPFPGLEDTYNIVRILYTEKEERWSTKESPERRDEGAITSDDGRELPMQVTLPWVTDNVTAQRIGKTALENGRRFRRHTMYHAPLFWLIEPLDVVAWTSAHNQYTAKDFDVEQISGNSAMIQSLVIRENDPSDFNWNPIEDELPYEIIPIVPIITPSQPVTGWQVFPAAIQDNLGRDRRPSIEVRFDGNLTDISDVRVQVRVAGGAVFWTGTIPYPAEPIATASIILNGDFPPNVPCEVRGRFVPISDRDTSWTAWLPVTTPNIRLLPDVDFDPYEGVIGFDNLDDDLREYQDWIGNGRREIERRLEELEIWLSDQDFGNEYDRQQIRQQLTATFDNARSEWKLDVDVVAAQNLALSQRVETLNSELLNQAGQIAAQATAVSALTTEVSALDGEVTAMAQAITSLSAGTDPNNTNTANFRMQVVSGPSGYSRIGAETRQGGTGAWRGAAWYLDTPNNPSLPTRFVVDAQQFIVTDTSGGGTVVNPLVFQSGILYLGAGVRADWAQIENVDIGWADIDTVIANNLIVQDAMIPANLITLSSDWSVSGPDVVFTTLGTREDVVNSGTINSFSGKPVLLGASISASYVRVAGGWGGASIGGIVRAYMQLRQGTTVLQEHLFAEDSWSSSSGSDVAASLINSALIQVAVPSSGNYNFRVVLRSTINASPVPSLTLSASGSVVTAVATCPRH